MAELHPCDVCSHNHFRLDHHEQKQTYKRTYTPEQKERYKKQKKEWAEKNREYLREYYRSWLAKGDNRAKRSAYELERLQRKHRKSSD